MSKRAFKSSASSGRVVAGFGGFGSSAASGSSVLSYIQEPLDLQTISDAKVVVVFKNLSKRDDTTKAKALDDLLVSIAEAQEVEDGILDAWVRSFPRLSIDNTRRVRQLSYSVNGKICSKAGKRTAKHMPVLSGPWLAGVHDNDRAVARAAQDALNLVFADAAKIAALRKHYHQSILGYCKDAMLHETVSSLSDERIVSKDDAENTYSRVVSSTVALLASLIEEDNADDLLKHTDTYVDLLDTKTFEFGLYSDAGVRRSTHRLLRLVALKLQDVLSERLKHISDVYVYKGLRSDQTASALDYIVTLVVLTQHFPTIWTDAYTGKKTAISRIGHLLQQGSQGAPAEYWTHLSQLVPSLPAPVIPSSSEQVNELLAAARKGLSRKEDRFQASDAWRTYRALAERVIEAQEQEAQKTTLKHNVLPAIEQYLFLMDEATEWTISGAKPATTLAYLVLTPGFDTVLMASMPALSDRLVELMKVSLPEQAKDHEKSQIHVASTGVRWSALQREIFQSSTVDPVLVAAFTSEDSRVITEALQLCASRNGKSYGAAAVVDSLLRFNEAALMDLNDVRQTLIRFVEQQLASLLLTPSSRYLLRCLSVLHGQSEYPRLLQMTLSSLLQSNGDTTQITDLIIALFSHNQPQDIVAASSKSSELQAFILKACQHDADKFTKFMSTGVVSHETQLQCIKSLVHKLSTEGQTVSTLKQLNTLAHSHLDTLLAYDSDPIAANNHLISSILHLTDSDEFEIANLATDLTSKLSVTSTTASSTGRLDIIRHALEDTSSTSSSIEALEYLAEQMLGSESNAKSYLSCFPDIEAWKADLNSILIPPPSCLSICGPFGGATYLLTDATSTNTKTQYDSEGFSKVLRAALLFIQLLQSPEGTLSDVITQGADTAASNSLIEMLVLSVVCIIAAEDKSSISTASPIWQTSPTTEAILLVYIDDAHQTVSSIVSELDEVHFQRLLDNTITLPNSKMSPLSYYLALARISLSLHRANAGKSVSNGELARTTRNLLEQDLFTALADVVSAAQSPIDQAQIIKLVNELVAKVTGSSLTAEDEAGQLSLIALNSILNAENSYVTHVAKQRVVFLVKHVLSELSSTESRIVGEEVLRTLTFLLPAIQDVYGEHWSEAINVVAKTWSSMPITSESSDHIPTLFYTLRLYAALRKLSTHEEPNEDLLDAFKENEMMIADGLIALLKTAVDTPDIGNQPRMITNELLARQVESLHSKPTVETTELLPLLYSPSSAVQEAAFVLLHDQIPRTQQQVSLDAALDNKLARLPDELVSMLLRAPNLEDFDQHDFERSVPSSLQGYLYSWRLLFDYFSGSSYKVKTDYSDQLKDGAYLSKLLSLTFDFLGLSRGKPVSIGGHDVVNYDSKLQSDAQKNTFWLLSHLYYLTLLHVPSLVKSYVLELRSRSVPAVIEEWTAKHISPSLITANLEAVSEWAAKTVNEDPDYEKMTVKVGLRSKEVNVSYVVDEQTMAIKVILPDAYPLAPALVVGVSRVAVREEKWQSWLRNCQGVITFSNGSISDGLSAWRRNVTGTLKGQAECAICYSIIGPDKQLPTKKCPTCKNLFHSSCLFKWFKTSNASTCPLCRNSFNFN